MSKGTSGIQRRRCDGRDSVQLLCDEVPFDSWLIYPVISLLTNRGTLAARKGFGGETNVVEFDDPGYYDRLKEVFGE